MTSCSVAVGNQRFGEPYCLHIQGESNTIRRHNPEALDLNY